MRILLPAATLVFAATLAGQSGITVIHGARVVDGTGAPARAVTVRIRGSQIDAVGTDIAVPTGARLIEANGQTLIPGLFDLHTHLWASAVSGAPADWGKNLKAYLVSGVTTVNDYSSYGEMYAPIRQLLSGGLPGPRVNLAARVSTTGGHGTESGWGDFMTTEVNTPEQAHARMKGVLAYKPDVIKVFTDGWRYGAAADLTSMNVQTLSAVVADAHAAGLKVVTHTVTLGGAKIAARAGVDVLVHGIGDAPVDVELLDLLKASGTAYVSTLAVYETHRMPPPERVLGLLDKPSLAIVARPAGAAVSPTAARARRWENLLGNVRGLFGAGIPVAAGTDAGMAGTYHGFASLHEIELLVEAGLTPLQAISAGTSVSARSAGVLAQRRTIEPDKLADLVLIDGRPDEKIADIEKTARVFLGGAEVDLKELGEAIRAEGLTPLPVKPVAAMVDDMERTDGRTQLGTLRVNSTDAGIDHSSMQFLPVIRSGRDHAMMVTARLAAREDPYVRLELPLTRGAVELGDVSGYAGVSFEVRGECACRFLAYTYGVATRNPFGAPFPVSGEWQTVRVPLGGLVRGGGGVWNPREVRALAFELSGAPGGGVWLQLDNVRFY